MTDYYARVSYTYSGGDKLFTVTFPYLDKDHIKVFINKTATTEFTFNTSSQILISADLTSGDTVLIKRQTPIEDKMVVFSNRNILDKDCQNLALDQIFYAVQEYIDEYGVLEIDTSAVLSLILSTSDTIDVKLENLQDIANACSSSAQTAQTAATTAKEQAELAQSTLSGINGSLTDKASIDLDNISSAGIEVIKSYTQSGSGTGAIKLTTWGDD